MLFSLCARKQVGRFDMKFTIAVQLCDKDADFSTCTANMTSKAEITMCLFNVLFMPINCWALKSLNRDGPMHLCDSI